jgi:AhpD family alkylhydroperoxidase
MSHLPSLPNGSLLEAFKAYPELAGPIHEFAQTLMRGSSPFSEGERELIAAYVSSLNGCEYCRRSHTAVAERFGVSAELVEMLLEDIGRAEATVRMKPVLHYVHKLNETPRVFSIF